MSTACEANGAPTRRQGEPPARLRDIPRRVREQLVVIIERDPRRHPRLGNGVTVGAGAPLLGPITARVDGAQR
jgi:hypothetical protein